jgi:hypothetical protein
LIQITRALYRIQQYAPRDKAIAWLQFERRLIGFICNRPEIELIESVDIEMNVKIGSIGCEKEISQLIFIALKIGEIFEHDDVTFECHKWN